MGSPAALSPLSWMLLVPVHLLGSVVAVTPPDAPWHVRPMAMATVVMAALSKAMVVFIVRQCLGAHLRGRVVDAVVVVLTWSAGVAVGRAIVTWLAPGWLGASTYAGSWGWYLTNLAQQLAVAAAVSAGSDLRTALAQSNASRIAANAHFASAKAWLIRLTTVANEGLHARIRTRLLAIVGSLPPPSAESEALASYARQLRTLGGEEVRDLAHTIAAVGYRCDAESEPRAKVANPAKLRLVFRFFPLVRPISYLPAAVMIPLGAQQVLDGTARGWISLAAIVTIYGLLFKALIAWTQSEAFRKLGTSTQWLSTQAALVAVGVLIWPMGLVFDTPDPMPFALLSRPLQALGLAGAFVVFNLVVGLVSLAFARETTVIAFNEAQAIIDTDQAQQIELATSEAQHQIISVLHGQAQGRLLALAMMLDEVAQGRRDWVAARPDVARELDSLATALESAQKQMWDPITGMVPLINDSLTRVLAAWRRICDVDLELEPSLADAEVAGDVADRVVRVVSEAVNNAVLHGGATRCVVRLSPDEPTEAVVFSGPTQRNPGVQVTVQADGLPLQLHREPGLGLAVVERETHGNWQLRSRSNAGTELTAVISPRNTTTVQAEMLR